VCRRHATYFWKVIDESYNFALDLTSIEGLQIFFMGAQNGKSHNFENSETPNLGVLKKMTFACMPHDQS
jgi:hypothetical protein